MRQPNFVVGEPKFTKFFCIRYEVDCRRKRRLPFIDISIRSRDICDQTIKLSENACTVDFGYVKMSKHSLVISGQKFTIFLA